MALGLLLLAGAGTASAQPPLNYSGSAGLIVASLEADRTMWAEFRIPAGATDPSQLNAFGADAALLGHTYFRLKADEAAVLAENLTAWTKAPHSLSVYSIDGMEIGMSLTGNAWSQSHQPVVILNIQVWIQQKRGHVHGGNYVALTLDQASALAGALGAWAAAPASGVEIYSATIS